MIFRSVPKKKKRFVARRLRKKRRLNNNQVLDQALVELGLTAAVQQKVWKFLG